LCPLGRRQVFNLLNDFLCVHASNYPHESALGKPVIQVSLASAQSWNSHRPST
jgi:hypothetical protein